MMAITTSNSIRVKAGRVRRRKDVDRIMGDLQKRGSAQKGKRVANAGAAAPVRPPKWNIFRRARPAHKRKLLFQVSPRGAAMDCGVCRVSAPKGRDRTAQGSALGNRPPPVSALKGHDRCRA